MKMKKATTKEKINKKIKELIRVLKEESGLSFVEYNRRYVNKPLWYHTKERWTDIICRQIVLLNTLKRK